MMRPTMLVLAAMMAIAFLVLALVITLSLTGLSVGATRVYRWA